MKRNFTDVMFNFQSVSLNQIYTETKQEEKKQYILKQYKKKYWDEIFEETEKIFRKLVSKNYKNENYFFHHVRRIKKTGIEFFKSLLELDIPEIYNTLFFAQIVMYEDEIYNCPVVFDRNSYGKFCLNIKEPMIVIKEYEKDGELKCEYLTELLYKLGCCRNCAYNLGFYGDSTKHTEEDFWNLYDFEKAYVEFDYQNPNYLEVESIFLK